MKASEKKTKESTQRVNSTYHDGGTLTHYLGNDEYKEGNRESDKESDALSKEIGHIALGNEDFIDLSETNT